MSTRIPDWGLVVAAPHEFLIQIRKGDVRRAEQGGSCWRFPSDVVALVDTSVKRLQFTADQITREKVGVAVTGLAVFRIVEPLLAYRTLDLREGEGDGYTTILQEMFVGATRRLVANLDLEECLSRRKDALAAELLAEVAPVVEGAGRPDDGTDRGWGIAIDTIEIQDVTILSEEVFSNLQAPYREALELEAMRNRAHVLAEQQRMTAEQARADDDLARSRTAAEIERKQARAAGRVQVAEQEAEAARVAGQAEADVIAMKRHAEASDLSDERLQEVLLTETLPRVAEAFRASYGQVLVTGGDGMDFLGSGLAQVMATARAFGVRLPGEEHD